MKMEMLRYGFVLFMFIQSLNGFKVTRQDNIVAKDGTSFKLNITTFDREEDILVMDSDGTPLIEVDNFGKGYVVDRLEKVCYLSAAVEPDKENFCYSSVEIAKKNLTEDILRKCEGRDIFLLVSKPDGCKNDFEYGSPASGVYRGMRRLKRASSVKVSYMTLRHIRGSYCCSSLFRTCVRTCRREELRLVSVEIEKSSTHFLLDTGNFDYYALEYENALPIY